VHYSRKLDARLGLGLFSIQAVKAVAFGLGCECADRYGSEVHDEIFYSARKGYYHRTNNAGGIEGGMSNGADIRVRLTMKPIATLKTPLRSVDMRSKRAEKANFERSDVCALTACGVIAEAVVAYELADAFLEKFGGDSLREIKRNYQGYIKQIRRA
jgi:chorismate synthase